MKWYNWLGVLILVGLTVFGILSIPNDILRQIFILLAVIALFMAGVILAVKD